MFKGQLNGMFKDLRRAGYFAKQSFTCCASCGWAEIPEGDSKKAVFYHKQDAEDVRRGKVYLSWSGDGDLISRIAGKWGLAVLWDGNPETRILIMEGVKG